MSKFSRMFNTLPKRLIAGGLIAAGIALPMAASAAQVVQIQASTGIANITAGDTSYSSSVNASYDQVVKVQVQYINTAPPSSNEVANGVHIKINMPTTAGVTQTITTDTTGSNTNDVTGQVTANTGSSDALLQYEAGTTVAKVTNEDGSISQFVVPDSQSAVTSLNPQGYLIDNGDPCQSASITVLARVMVPGVKIVKQVEEANQTNAWAQSNTASPGDTLKYMITYQNTGNTIENQVIIRDNLPPKMTLVPNTTTLYDVSHPSGLLLPDNDITQGGENIGNFGAGANAYVVFEVQVPPADQLACGTTQFTNVGVAHPQGMNEYDNSAITDVTRTCAQTPVYTCNLLSVTTGDNRTVTVNNFTNTAQNGATFKDVVLDWGDNSTPLTTNNAIGQTHQYANDGTYTITAVAHFDVNGQDVTASGVNCTQTVSFTTPTTPGTVITTTSSTPAQLVNTGPGDVVALFGLTTVVGAVAHRLFSRRFARS